MLNTVSDSEFHVHSTVKSSGYHYCMGCTNFYFILPDLFLLFVFILFYFFALVLFCVLLKGKQSNNTDHPSDDHTV